MIILLQNDNTYHYHSQSIIMEKQSPLTEATGLTCKSGSNA